MSTEMTYILTFIAGIMFTLSTELVIAVIWGVRNSNKQKRERALAKTKKKEKI